MAGADSFRGRVVVVTGAGSGIGRGIAEEFGQRGGSVVVSDVNEAAAAEVAEAIVSSGGIACAVACDVCISDAVRDLMAAAADAYGRLDVVVNNAGIHETQLTERTTVDEIPDDVFDRVLDVNVRGVFLGIKHAAPHLRRGGGGVILNAGSTSSFVGNPMGPGYCASKGAVLQLTKVAAIDLAAGGIRVNCYCPGSVETPLVRRYVDAAADPAAAERDIVASHLVPRLGRPDDIASLVCFLASDEAAFINGAGLLIDGGQLAWRGVRDN